ncbi:unnamed protein product [Rotaria socialis]|uniref:Uncharacterized protein n=3 Tax=Rotaria socialis TaxID=392032 RepID=A0A818P5R1_9BILA|nr:unnamed protein product [Rotaria socialis]CAF3377043.1 unnamed protein product [Rotaria socialis]CAF3617931.1 unnamed protein product [Rotaria socialis]CAF4251604.1 unnamed protein product [Rotaria socialis]
MAEERQGLSTLGEDEERSGIDVTTGTIIRADQQDELEPLDELEDLAPSVKTDANKFRMLCDNVQNSYSEIDNSMFELLELKDNLLLQFLPPNVSTRITLVISRLYRSYSLSQIPINELVRLVQLYSQPFDMKSIALKKLYENNEMKKRMLNIALQRLTTMEHQVKRHTHLKCVTNWEKMYIRLALPRSNVRKWKFRLKTFRETAHLGYEHVIAWIHANAPRSASDSENASKDEPVDDEDEIGDADRIEPSGDIVSVPEIDEQQQRIEQGSDFGDDIESDNEGSFLSSAGKQRNKLAAGSTEAKEAKPAQQQTTVTKVDVDIQARPTVDDQQTSTGDMLSTKSLIIRIYRPVGLLKAKFQCIIHAQQQKFTTTVFAFDKPNSSKEDSSKTKGRLSTSRISKPPDPKAKKRGVDSVTPDEVDVNTIDKQQSDEILVPMPSVLKRRSLFETEVDPDSIQIELFGDEKLCGSVILSPEDLRMLDLPSLNSPTSAPLIVIDDSVSSILQALSPKEQFDFDQQSSEVYKLWISRTPQTFAVYNEKRESVAKIPLQMFWYNKVEITHATKCTMTAPLEIHVPPPLPPPPPPLPQQQSTTVYVPQIPTPIETQDKALSPFTSTPRVGIDESTEPAPSRLTNVGDSTEAIQATYEDKISRLHESYQAEIRRLTKLLNEGPSHRSSQMAELSELEENMRESIDEPSDLETRRHGRQQTKREVVFDNQPPPVYGKGLPKKFLDRYHMFLERSMAHRNQLVSKVEQDAARTVERQMEIQHRLHRPEQNEERYDDLCLPAVFMPFRSGNVFNPRAYRFFHHVGSTDPRLTQTPSIFKLPPLPSGSVSVLNLFELSRCYEAASGKERTIDKTTSQSSQPGQPPAPPTTQTSN